MGSKRDRHHCIRLRTNVYEDVRSQQSIQVSVICRLRQYIILLFAGAKRFSSSQDRIRWISPPNFSARKYFTATYDSDDREHVPSLRGRTCIDLGSTRMRSLKSCARATSRLQNFHADAICIDHSEWHFRLAQSPRSCMHLGSES